MGFDSLKIGSLEFSHWRGIKEVLEAAGIEVGEVAATMLPKTTISVEDEATARKVLRLIDALEELDDVQDVYANFDIPEQVLEAVAS